MPKRKHNDISGPSPPLHDPTPKALRLQRLHLDSLLDQSKTSLFRSLKVARGFERQKLGRRQKTAKAEKNLADTARLDAEVAALKTLDLASTAETHLYKSLLKIKSIASAPAFPHHVQATLDDSKKPQEAASANVQARLFKSGPVQVAMTEALKGIRATLGVAEVKPKSKKRLRAKDFANGDIADDATKTVISKREESPVSSTGARHEDEWSGLPTAPERPNYGEEEPEAEDEDEDALTRYEDEFSGLPFVPERPKYGEDPEAEAMDAEDADYDIYNSRLAGSRYEEELDDYVDGLGNDLDGIDYRSITPEAPSYGPSDPDSDAQQDARPLDPLPPKTSKSKPKPKPPTAPPTKTTFLPSLSLAGYWSGSDSASSSSSSVNNLSTRKNRMGQQARRALWEKKFGNNAHHVKKKQLQAADRDQGWDARKGAVDEFGREKSWRGTKGATGANSDPVGVKKKEAKVKGRGKAGAQEEEGPLHPSWEAARKAKEAKKAVPFQGKKVVFD